jgi:hypothetical protein
MTCSPHGRKNDADRGRTDSTPCPEQSEAAEEKNDGDRRENQLCPHDAAIFLARHVTPGHSAKYASVRVSFPDAGAADWPYLAARRGVSDSGTFQGCRRGTAGT